MDKKQLLRRELVKKERTLRDSDFSREDHASCISLLRYSCYQDASYLFAFFPLPSEVDIRPVLIDALKHKRLALPKIGADGYMSFRGITSLEDLKTGNLGVEEPQEGIIVQPDRQSLILVPAMAFTKQRTRLGRGKGYYDRFLQRYPETRTLGLCRTHQIVEELPTDEWDRKVDTLLAGGMFY